MTHLPKEAQVHLLEQVIEAISGDKFLTFIERYTHSLISPLSAKFLPWCDEALTNLHETDDNEEGGRSSLTSSISGYSFKHHEAFQSYQLMFESRIQSVLRRTKVEGAAVSAEVFFELCAAVVERKSDREAHEAHQLLELEIEKRSGAAALRDLEKHLASGAHQAHQSCTVEDLCEALMEIVIAVSTFEQFAEMMKQRQLELLQENDDGDESDDDEG